jgi:hypothetical protein
MFRKALAIAETLSVMTMAVGIAIMLKFALVLKIFR